MKRENQFEGHNFSEVNLLSKLINFLKTTFYIEIVTLFLVKPRNSMYYLYAPVKRTSSRVIFI